MALVDPNIAMGYKGIEMPNQLAQYGLVSQIQNSQQANQLHQMQMAEYERARSEEETTRNFLGRADLNDPNIRMQLLTQFGKSGREISTNLTAAEKARSEETARQSKLMQDTQVLYQNMSGMISNKADAATFLHRMVNDPSMKGSPIARIPLMEQIQKIPEDPQGLENWKQQFALGATKYITENKPVTFAQDTGSGGRVMSRPGLGGSATLVPGSDFTKTMTFADITAAKQATTSAGQLNLAKQKFAWEQANPGFELKEDADGNFFGVNKRTLQASPVTIGGPALAVAAPTAGVNMPGARTQAIPGMNSVLDQQTPATAPAAGVPGAQLVGKGQAMTEAQSNAAMFGGAMAQAQNTIKQLEKSGTVKNAVVPGLLTGLAQMVPFGVGENIGNVITSTFNADPTGLIGPNAAQQKLAQAQLAFAIAYLRKTSGAAFGASEVSNTIKEYFPLQGEGDSVIAQKAAARDRALEGMKISTSKEGKKYIENYGGSGTPSAAGNGGIPNATPTNPLGLSIPGVR